MALSIANSARQLPRYFLDGPNEENWAGHAADHDVLAALYNAGDPSVSGRWYQQRGSTGGGTPSADSMRYVQMVFPIVTLDRIAMEVTTGGAGSTHRLGIYADDGTGRPGVLIVDAGTVSTTATGVKEATISQVLAAGLHWLATVQQGGTPPAVRTVDFSGAFETSNVAQTSPGLFIEAGVSGALPATATPVISLGVAVPRILVRVA